MILNVLATILPRDGTSRIILLTIEETHFVELQTSRHQFMKGLWKTISYRIYLIDKQHSHNENMESLYKQTKGMNW